MCGADEDWVKAAMTDDSLVVELLVRLHDAAPPPRPSASSREFRLAWSVRQPRSRSLSVVNSLKMQTQIASPSTPLTWSGATSLSGSSGGGCEEVSGTPPAKRSAAAARSKINGESEKTISKRPRRKKTLLELREEESSLLIERKELNREISRQRMHLQKQRKANEELTRMKIELHPLRESLSAAEESIAALPQGVPNSDVEPRPFAECRSKSLLPDLNIPFEDEAICGVS